MQDIVKEIICNLVMFNNVLLITLQSLQLLNFNNHNATEAISDCSSELYCRCRSGTFQPEIYRASYIADAFRFL